MTHAGLTSTALWMMLLLGAYHGINPGMGWLFAVALGMQEQKGSAVVRSLIPIAIGHALAIGTVVLSWAFTHTIFALHYAHGFYGEHLRKSGLKFPGEGQPDYWDFIYFAFVIGMTFQVSDVAITNKSIRRTVVAHGALSFFF